MFSLDLDLPSTVLLLGVVNGLILSLVIIFRNPSPARPKYWLGVFVGAFALVLFDSWGTLVNLEDELPAFGYTYYRSVSIIPLSLWLYVQGLTDSKIRIGITERGAGAAVALELSIVIACLLTRGDMMGQYFWTRGLFFDLLGMAVAVVMMYCCLRRIRTYARRLDNNYADRSRTDLRWLRQLFTVLLLLMGWWVATVLINAYSATMSLSFVWLWTAMALTVFYIGIKGYLSPDIIHDFEMVPVWPHPPKPLAHGSGWVASDGEDSPRLLRRKISESNGSATAPEVPPDSRDDRAIQELTELMEVQKLYRTPKLSVQDVADRLHLSPKYVSALINQHFRVNFSDFVNRYRVEEVKQRIDHDAPDTHTLLAIGLDAGFNSKSSFYQTFRQLVGQTPTQYRATGRP